MVSDLGHVCWGEAQWREASQEAAAGNLQRAWLGLRGVDGAGRKGWIGRKKRFIHLEGMLGRTWWLPGYD